MVFFTVDPVLLVVDFFALLLDDLLTLVDLRALDDLLALEDFDELLFEAEPFFFAAARAAAARFAAAALRRAEADEARLERSGRFQSWATSARKLAGIAITPFGSSMTARAAASARSLRTSEMTFDGRRARAACTRFVSRMTNI